MTLATSISKDPEALTLTIYVELDVPVERAWQLWADPRQFERWWGPPSHPVSVVEYDLTPGGRVKYFMTGPEGDKSDGSWNVLAVDPPKRLELKDADVDDLGRPNDGNGMTTMVVTLTERAGGGTLMGTEVHFYSVDAMEQGVEMGVGEGMTALMSQIEAVLADD